MLENVESGAVSFRGSPALMSAEGVLVAFTNRRGGSSEPPFDSLNLSYNVGDGYVSVTSNRDRLWRELSISPSRAVFARQVHGCRVCEVGEVEAGRGAFDHASGIPGCDALVTGASGIAVGVLVADCLPLLLVGPSCGRVAAVHAGWKGLLDGIVERSVVCTGPRVPGELHAFIGPHIGSCCMRVGPEVAEPYRSKYGASVLEYGDDGECRLDMGAACLAALAASGVDPGRVHSVGECTACGSGYFSHRMSGGHTGRQAALVMIAD